MIEKFNTLIYDIARSIISIFILDRVIEWVLCK